MKRFYDRHRDDPVNYRVGDLVWLDATNLASSRPSKKLDAHRVGPYAIDAKIGQASYRL